MTASRSPRLEAWLVICRNYPAFTMHVKETDRRSLAECARSHAGRDYLDFVRFEPVNAAAKEVAKPRDPR